MAVLNSWLTWVAMTTLLFPLAGCGTNQNTSLAYNCGEFTPFLAYCDEPECEEYSDIRRGESVVSYCEKYRHEKARCSNCARSLFACETDADCVVVRSGCLDCEDLGGFITLNKGAAPAYERRRDADCANGIVRGCTDHKCAPSEGDARLTPEQETELKAACEDIRASGSAVSKRPIENRELQNVDFSNPANPRVTRLEPRYFAHCMDDYKECGWGIFKRYGTRSRHGSKVLVPAGLIVSLGISRGYYASPNDDNIDSPFGCPWLKRQDRCPEASGGGN